MSETKIIFYDVASNKPGFCWSPNTWKTRFTMNYKGIPYTTEWLEFPEIENKCKELGIPPTRTKPDGSGPMYTLPVIWDPLTRTGVSESYRIAQYLEEAYPDTPRVLFDGIEIYDQVINCTSLPAIRPIGLFVMAHVPPLLSLVSQEYYKRTREAWFNRKWEDFLPTGTEKEEAWKGIKEGFDALDLFLKENERSPIDHEQLSYPDIVLGALFYALRLIWGEESELWQDVLTWNDGRWVTYLKRVEKYVTPSL